jgi:hypothetical protein
MKRKGLIAFLVAGLGTIVAVTAGTLLVRADAPSERVAVVGEHVPEGETVGAQPDTNSQNWKSLSDDVGIMVRYDERLGLRGRLYVRVDGAWRAVAADGAADILGRVPAK